MAEHANAPVAQLVGVLNTLRVAVIGNVVVYRDSHHLTETYARLLADTLSDRMDEALERT